MIKQTKDESERNAFILTVNVVLSDGEERDQFVLTTYSYLLTGYDHILYTPPSI